MRAIEFNSEIKNNAIRIPDIFKKEIGASQSMSIRVIVLIDETNSSDDYRFQQLSKEQFLKGYAESDSVYDNY